MKLNLRWLNFVGPQILIGKLGCFQVNVCSIILLCLDYLRRETWSVAFMQCHKRLHFAFWTNAFVLKSLKHWVLG